MKKCKILALLLCFGCFQSNTKVPADILTKEEMVELMIHVHLVESRVYKLYLKEDSATKVYNHYEQLMLDSLNIPKEKYEQSMKFYFGEVKLFRKVYEEVVDSLLARQKRSDIR